MSLTVAPASVCGQNIIPTSAHAIVHVAFACTSVQLGLPLPLSVSTRKPRATETEPFFIIFKFSEDPETQLPKAGKDTRVFAVTSHIFCEFVAFAVSVTGSINTGFHAVISSHAGYVESSQYAGLGVTYTANPLAFV